MNCNCAGQGCPYWCPNCGCKKIQPIQPTPWVQPSPYVWPNPYMPEPLKPYWEVTLKEDDGNG